MDVKTAGSLGGQTTLKKKGREFFSKISKERKIKRGRYSLKLPIDNKPLMWYNAN